MDSEIETIGGTYRVGSPLVTVAYCNCGPGLEVKLVIVANLNEGTDFHDR